MAKEKVYTLKQLQRRVNFIRNAGSVFMPSALKSGKGIDGTEKFLDTAQGKVRVLTYHMDNPETLPLFINIHGSGFTLGNAEMDDPFMMNIALNAHVKIISIDYALAPDYPFPVAIEQCYAVAEYAKNHPAEFGIDADRIAMGGHSAGGNFTAGVGLMDNKRNALGLKCLILDYPPLDIYTDAALKPKGTLPVWLSRMFDACYCLDKGSRKNPLISPVYAASEQLAAFPPTLVITASKDSLCAEGEKFKDMLLEAGVDVTHKRFNAAHGFNLKPGPETDASWQLMITYLKRYLWEEN